MSRQVTIDIVEIARSGRIEFGLFVGADGVNEIAREFPDLGMMRAQTRDIVALAVEQFRLRRRNGAAFDVDFDMRPRALCEGFLAASAARFPQRGARSAPRDFFGADRRGAWRKEVLFLPEARSRRGGADTSRAMASTGAPVERPKIFASSRRPISARHQAKADRLQADLQRVHARRPRRPPKRRPKCERPKRRLDVGGGGLGCGEGGERGGRGGGNGGVDDD